MKWTSSVDPTCSSSFMSPSAHSSRSLSPFMNTSTVHLAGFAGTSLTLNVVDVVPVRPPFAVTNRLQV